MMNVIRNNIHSFKSLGIIISFLIISLDSFAFSPATVERLQETILDGREPDRFVQVPVYDYSNSAA